MNNFRSEQYGFEIDLPAGWHCPWSGFIGRLLGLDRHLTFRSCEGFFDLDFGDIPFDQINDGTRAVTTGTLRVYGKDHQWMRYIALGSMALQLPASRQILKSVKATYGGVVDLITNPEFPSALKPGASLVGPVLKTYCLAFDGKIFNFTASLGFGTLADVGEEFESRESTYDRIISSFRLLEPVTSLTVRVDSTPFDEPRENYDAFISYRSSNANCARTIADQLIAAGLNPWFAEYTILVQGRQKFQERTDEGLARSKSGLLLFSDGYTDSWYCMHELEVLRNRLGDSELLGLHPDGMKPAAYNGPTGTISEASCQREALRLIAEKMGWNIERLDHPGRSSPSHLATCFGIPYSLDFSGWRDIRNGDVHAPHDPNQGFVARYPTSRGFLSLNLLHGSLEDEHDPTSYLNEAKSDREMYERAIEWVRGHSDRYAHRLRGVHLVHLGASTHLAITYYSGVAGLWMRKYAIVIPHPVKHHMKLNAMEFVFSFGCSGSFRNLVSLSPIMEDLVQSLRWPDSSETAIRSMLDRANRLTMSGHPDMAKVLESVVSDIQKGA